MIRTEFIFHLVKEDAIMSKSNEEGFVLLEITICLALLTLLSSIIIPIMIQLKTEQMILSQRLEIYHYLHNMVQTIETDELPYSDSQRLETIDLDIEIYLENDLIIAQGVWMNAKEQSEQAAVYFQPSR